MNGFQSGPAYTIPSPSICWPELSGDSLMTVVLLVPSVNDAILIVLLASGPPGELVSRAPGSVGRTIHDTAVEQTSICPRSNSNRLYISTRLLTVDKNTALLPPFLGSDGQRNVSTYVILAVALAPAPVASPDVFVHGWGVPVPTRDPDSAHAVVEVDRIVVGILFEKREDRRARPGPGSSGSLSRWPDGGIAALGVFVVVDGQSDLLHLFVHWRPAASMGR